jgi:hypothetical protein
MRATVRGSDATIPVQGRPSMKAATAARLLTSISRSKRRVKTQSEALKALPGEVGGSVRSGTAPALKVEPNPSTKAIRAPDDHPSRIPRMVPTTAVDNAVRVRSPRMAFGHDQDQADAA